MEIIMLTKSMDEYITDSAYYDNSNSQVKNISSYTNPQ